VTDFDRVRSAPVVVVTEQDRRRLVLSIVEPIEIGRDCRGLIVPDASISRRHLALHPTAEGLFVADLGSLNGSTIDGHPLMQDHRLIEGEIVRFGGCTLILASSHSGGPCPTRRVPTVTDDPPATPIRLLADAALELRPPTSKPDDAGTVTIVFTEIEGPPDVEVCDPTWHEVVSVHNRILRTMLARHHGSETLALGACSMMCFREARDAAFCVIDAQRAVTAYEAANPSAASRIRAGIHIGEISSGDGGDLFAGHVAMVAAIAEQAQSGEILASSLVREIIEQRGDATFGASRKVALNGLGGVHLVHSVVH
jgi:class 3 adenylate cyclase